MKYRFSANVDKCMSSLGWRWLGSDKKSSKMNMHAFSTETWIHMEFMLVLPLVKRAVYQRVDRLSCKQGSGQRGSEIPWLAGLTVTHQLAFPCKKWNSGVSWQSFLSCYCCVTVALLWLHWKMSPTKQDNRFKEICIGINNSTQQVTTYIVTRWIKVRFIWSRFTMKWVEE